MKNIIIFGTGEFGKDAYFYYNSKSNVNIVAFCDNNKDKLNTIFYEKRIISPLDIKDIKYDQIVIASSFDDEINKQLLNMQISKEKIKTLNLNQIKIQFENGNRLLLAEKLMLDLANLFNIQNIPYHIDHGTLLGIVRDKELMPWDIDIDFAILHNDKDTVLELLNSWLAKYTTIYCEKNNWKCSLHNCTIKLNNEKDSMPMVIKVFNDADDSNSNSFFIDIELKYLVNTNLYWMVGSRKLTAPLNICFPATILTFKNIDLKVPKDTESYLSLLYGEWTTVVKDWSYDQYSNIEEIK